MANCSRSICSGYALRSSRSLPGTGGGERFMLSVSVHRPGLDQNNGAQVGPSGKECHASGLLGHRRIPTACSAFRGLASSCGNGVDSGGRATPQSTAISPSPYAPSPFAPLRSSSPA
jgi:hypothetical protein